MKRIFALQTIFLVASLFMASCSDDNEDFRDGKPETYRPVPEMVQQQNASHLGLAVADEHNLYYWTNDSETSAILCRRDKASGQTTILDRIEKESAPDVELVFNSLYLHNGYLYYMPMGDVLKRVKSDGSFAPQALTNQPVKVYYMPDRILCTPDTYDGLKAFTMDYEGQNRQELTLPADILSISSIAFRQGRYYLHAGFETTDNSYEFRILSCAADGSDCQTLCHGHDVVMFVMGNDRIYMVALTENLPTLPHPFFDYSIYSLPLEGGTPTELVTGVSINTAIAYHDGYLYYGISDTEVPVNNGLYRYRTSDGNVETLIKGSGIYYFNLVADDLIVFLDDEHTTCNRFGTPFETDFQGSYIRALTADGK